MPNLRDDHLPPVGHLTPVYPKHTFFWGKFSFFFDLFVVPAIFFMIFSRAVGKSYAVSMKVSLLAFNFYLF
jgi:hypothetical protein